MARSQQRREFLRGAAVAAGAVLVGGAGPSEAAKRKRVLRVAHLTDIHVQPELEAGEGMAACLEHVLRQKSRPDLILTGGDLIMDGFAQDEARVRAQWRVWDSVLRDYNAVPIRHCLGNHDIWGWDRAASRTTGQEPLWGKRWAVEHLGLRERYYAFDQAGWNFVVLDSTHPHGAAGYTARLDEPQFEWLAGHLAKVPQTTPVLVLSHIPILCGCAFMDGETEKTGNWVVPGAWMHIDARRIKDLFFKHPNVKVALSGHIHLQDRLEYNGVTYLCNGAVSGAWWKGAYQETQPGYALVDLYSDGTFQHQYVHYATPESA